MPEPACDADFTATIRLGGVAGDYVRAVIDQWLMIAPDANPAMLDMFRDRNRVPHRDLVAWAGEFAGKYLTAATQVLHITGDTGLRQRLRDFVQRLVALQRDDGYLGPWPDGYELAGTAPNCSDTGTWDAWGHYHIMLGLLLWHRETGDTTALHSAQRIGDLLCDKFLRTPGQRLIDIGSSEMNLAPIHSMCLLHRVTGIAQYLELARKIADEFGARQPDGTPLAGDYIDGALRGQQFYELPKPRWESLHSVMALPELYYTSDDDRYRIAFERLWWSIVRHDRHNNGGFASAEQAQGNPYHEGSIETCCTIAWAALTVEMLRLTADPRVADELELSTLNSVLGLHSPSGRWATYNTPMNGVRKSSAHDLVFQSRPGSPEINCCSVNAARGLGLIGEWAVMRAGPALLVNWYGPCTIETTVTSGARITIAQQTTYPVDGTVTLRIDASEPERFPLQLRIPSWSNNTRVSVSGGPSAAAEPGTYYTIDRRWSPGDRVDLELDLTLHHWRGEDNYAGKTAVYRGPLLLAFDTRLNDLAPDALDELSIDASEPYEPSAHPDSKVLVAVPAMAGGKRAVTLCDFASAGHGGTTYESWLPLNVDDSTPFHVTTDRRDRPLVR